ncbi:hypothetical protein ACOBR2_07575 [Telmatobacter bradus]|uniref:hypothetical protein n=1 Tax=Telmatobacter bradus TaxID=474953 RepID=UPI003B43BA19
MNQVGREFERKIFAQILPYLMIFPLNQEKNVLWRGRPGVVTAKFNGFRQVASSAGWSRTAQLLPGGKTTNHILGELIAE